MAPLLPQGANAPQPGGAPREGSRDTVTSDGFSPTPPRGDKRRRYSVEPDVEVEVEDEVFHLHSQVLMLASPVFCQMLSHDMREANEGRIVLKGKSKAEFKQVLPFLTSVGWGHSRPGLCVEEVPVLLQWSVEYDISGLRQACERVLLTQQDPACPAALKTAVDFGLSDRAAQCVAAITKDVANHLDALRPYADEAGVMEPLWPAIFRSAGVAAGSVEAVSGRPSIGALWPLIEKAVFGLPVRSKKEVTVGMRVRVIDDVEGLRASCRQRLGWQDQMATCAGQVGLVIEKDEDDDINIKFPHGGNWFIPHTALLRAGPK